MARSAKNRNYYRITTQVVVLALLVYMLVRSFADRQYRPDFEAYCPFGGMQSLASFLQSNSLACSMTTVQIAMGIALLLGVVLVSKLFCSYICPLGTITEWIGTLGRKARMNFTLKGLADRALRILKYALLFITVYFTVTSSELFCRKFDPFYTTLTGFGHDVNLTYAIAALVLLVAGSFFIRQFWCKYICPLGAVTNLAVYALPSAALILLWVLLTGPAKLHIPWPWLLGSVCLTGFILESTTLRFLIFPGLRITRNDNLCTHCRICDKKCPMAIDISNISKVEHIDCHLCVDCVVKCPEKGALSVNKKNINWLPAAATLVLIVSALVFSSYVELPTISERWGNPNSATVQKLEINGLKNIKCFGSSRSFSNHMKEVKGVVGVETFVKHHKVAVYYDSAVIKARDVKAAVFSPFSALVNYAKPTGSSIAFVEWGIDKCFDPNDQYYLYEKLMQHSGILALETHFGEPVAARIFYNPAIAGPDAIRNLIEQKSLTIKERGQQTTIETGFSVAKEGKSAGIISLPEFLRLFFQTQDIMFNKYEKYTQQELAVLTLPFARAAETEMQPMIPYLISHSSNDDGIVRFQTEFSDSGPLLKLWYVKAITSPEKILKLLNASELVVYFPDKHTEKTANPFNFR